MHVQQEWGGAAIPFSHTLRCCCCGPRSTLGSTADAAPGSQSPPAPPAGSAPWELPSNAAHQAQQSVCQMILMQVQVLRNPKPQLRGSHSPSFLTRPWISREGPSAWCQGSDAVIPAAPESTALPSIVTRDLRLLPFARVPSTQAKVK